MEKLKKGDDVIVIAGKDKGKRGVVLRAVVDSHLHTLHYDESCHG